MRRKRKNRKRLIVALVLILLCLAGAFGQNTSSSSAAATATTAISTTSPRPTKAASLTPAPSQSGSDDVGMMMFCCTLPIFLLLLAALGWGLYKQYQAKQTLIKEKQMLQQSLFILKNQATDYLRNEWLSSPPTRFRNEVEVEAKFIYPLVKHLGYDDDQIALRYWVTVQVGRQEIRGEADWVIFSNGKPFLVIEAKEPNVDPSQPKVIEQGRSYAFALGAPYYMCTNGHRILLFRRNIERDEKIMDFLAASIAEHWGQMNHEIGRRAYSSSPQNLENLG